MLEIGDLMQQHKVMLLGAFREARHFYVVLQA